jgi:hypothetical protein
MFLPNIIKKNPKKQEKLPKNTISNPKSQIPNRKSQIVNRKSKQYFLNNVKKIIFGN